VLYLSQVLGRPILDARSDMIATIRDILVRYGDDDHPPVLGIVARLRRRDFFIPNRNLAELNERGAKMSSRHRRDRYDLTILQLVTMT